MHAIECVHSEGRKTVYRVKSVFLFCLYHSHTMLRDCAYYHLSHFLQNQVFIYWGPHVVGIVLSTGLLQWGGRGKQHRKKFLKLHEKKGNRQ